MKVAMILKMTKRVFLKLSNQRRLLSKLLRL